MSLCSIPFFRKPILFYYKFTKKDFTGELTIPGVFTETYVGTDGLTQTRIYTIEIGESAFMNCKGLTSVIIDDNITEIGKRAFGSCTNLKSVTLPKRLKTISPYLFWRCSSLTDVTIKDSVTSIGSYAFYNCSSLTTLALPETINEIGASAFYNCSSLTTLALPETINEIGASAFYNCSSLTSINIPSSVRELDNFIFYGCRSLTSIDMPQGITTIGDCAFQKCYGLTTIKIPNSVEYIGDSAFSDCEELTSLVIPYSVTSTGYSIFSKCKNLKNIILLCPNLEDMFVECFGLPTDATIYTFPEQANEIKKYWNGDIQEIPIGIDQEASISEISFRIGNVSSIAGLPFTVTRVTARGTTISPDASGKYRMETNEPAVHVDFIVYFTLDGEEQQHRFRMTSAGTCPTLSIYNSTLTTATFTVSASYDKTAQPTEIGIYVNGQYYTVASGDTEDADSVKCGRVKVTGLQTGRTYVFQAYAKYNGKTCFGSLWFFETIDIYTYFSFSYENSTQTTATFTVSAQYDEKIQPSEFGVNFNGQHYPVASGDIENVKNFKRGEIIFNGLQPGRIYDFRAYAKYDGQTFYGDWVSVETKGISASFSYESVSPTTITLKGRCKAGDAIVEDSWFTIDGVRYDSINGVRYDRSNVTFTGLHPDTEYNVTFNYTTEDGSTASSNTLEITTKELELTMLNPQPVSSTCAIMAAETNISDAETNVGFQWRKYEAPETLPSSEGYAAIYDGRIEGYIKRLQSASFYNARAFYKSASGTYYYSDWVTFDPSDFSYFEPTVHTYAVETVTESTANVKGYVLAGTDEITQQGFEYWPKGGTGSAIKQMAVAIADNATDDGVSVVFSTGQVMTATLDGLSSATTYRIRAFVTTAQGTTYGEEQTFTTAKPTGIAAAEEQAEAPAIVGYYDLSGRPLESPQKGITIVRYSDGTCKKIFKR